MGNGVQITCRSHSKDQNLKEFKTECFFIANGKTANFWQTVPLPKQINKVILQENTENSSATFLHLQFVSM